jgi:hypothetical protein
MITIRYRNFILNGTDMSGKEVSVTQEEADKLVRLGYADIVSKIPQLPVVDNVRVTKYPAKKRNFFGGKRRGSKN